MNRALSERPTKTCLTCSRTIVSSSDSKRFICPRCRGVGRALGRKRCAACGDRFYIAGTNEDRRRKSCSNECARYLIASATIERSKR